MPRKWPPYVSAFKDQTGKMRYYLRRAGQALIPLPGQPGTREFGRAYKDALLGRVTPKPKKVRLARPPEGHIYYLSDGERVKIGFTIDWERRQKTYRTHNAGDLTLLALRPARRPEETMVHRRFKHLRIGDSEWFTPGQVLLAHIEEAASELNAA